MSSMRSKFAHGIFSNEELNSIWEKLQNLPENNYSLKLQADDLNPQEIYFAASSVGVSNDKGQGLELTWCDVGKGAKLYSDSASVPLIDCYSRVYSRPCKDEMWERIFG